MKSRLAIAYLELGLRWLHDRARRRRKWYPGRGGLILSVLLSSCGPAFQSDLFGGEQDAATVLEATAPEETSDVDAREAQQGERDAGPSALDGDAASEVNSPVDGGLEACSCAELCSGAYPLRACQSCYQETCPTWEGGLPE